MEVGELVLETLEKDFKEVNEKLNYQNSQQIPIIVYPDSASLGKSFGWDANQYAMGVYWAGVIKVLSPKAWLDTNLHYEGLKEKFRKKGPMVHEYAHLVVDYRTQGNYTRWFTEGIAQLLEKEITGFQFNDETNDIDKNEWYDLKDMNQKFDSLPNQGLAYQQSLTMVEWILERYGYQGLNDILDNLGKGKSLDYSFQTVMNITLDQFEEIFKK